LGIIVTIDGPAGAGKSTVAKLVAQQLGLLHLDTGAMYRAVAWAAKAQGISPDHEEEVAKLAEKMLLCFIGNEVFVDGNNITKEIRTGEMGILASAVSAIANVRIAMVTLQRRLALSAEKGVVVEGRDMGTVVFPDTPYKFYLDASLKERARRRLADLHTNGEDNLSLVKMMDDITQRDNQDMNRKNSPLRIADGAEVIDTTNLSIEQVVNLIATSVTNRLS
jgi:CMP/dCMP kinase